ncbi:exported hypothetical protein [Cupriavidus necator]|uniref:Uncharacterized protein n=1 Tax=Cupriavidus necator TaxID=106590 RepID=A0A1K0ILD3_CUPNE|nr:exported hypothetical protein [Cupriavidus necator]
MNIIFRATAFNLLLAFILAIPRICIAQQQSYPIIFMGSKFDIEFETKQVADGEGVEARLLGRGSKRSIFVAIYEPDGGSTPRIVSAFTNGRKLRKLFVIVAWGVDAPALNTGGSIYQVFIYDEKLDVSNGDSHLHEDISLGKRFGIGFDGVREGRKVTYKYKNASAVRRQLILWNYR